MQVLSIKEQLHPSLIWQESVRRVHQLSQALRSRFARAVRASKERLAVAIEFSRLCEALVEMPKVGVRDGVLEGFLICRNRTQSIALYQGDNLFHTDEIGRLVGESAKEQFEEGSFQIHVRDGVVTLRQQDQEQEFCSNEQIGLAGRVYLIKLLPSSYQRKESQ